MKRFAARAAHDIGLAALLGGNLFGRLAMHPALHAVSSQSERGTVVNSAWRRYGRINSLALLGVVGGWAALREDDPSVAKDAAVTAVALTGVASAIEGVRFGHSVPGGAVPLESGTKTAAETPERSARIKRGLNTLGRASAVAEIALLAINALTTKN